jgi:hypothetical protein
LEARLAPEHLHRCKGDIVRQLLLTTLVTGAISAGLTASASAADTVEVGDPTGDAIIYRGDGTVEKNRRAAIDVRDTELRAGRYRTEMRVEMTDVTRKVSGDFRFRVTLVGDNGDKHWVTGHIQHGSSSGSIGGDASFYDCALPKFDLSADDDTFTFSALNDCMGNPDAVRARIKVRHDFNRTDHVVDKARIGMVDYSPVPQPGS